MFGFNRKAQALAQREAELAQAEEIQAEIERKAYLAGLIDGRIEVYNSRNSDVKVTREIVADVMSGHIARQVRPDLPMRRR